MRVISDGARITAYVRSLFMECRNNYQLIESSKSDLLIGTTSKHSMEFLKQNIMTHENGEWIVVICDFFKDSALTKRYLKHYFEKGIREPNIQYYFIDYVESDHIQMIEDEHNGVVTLKKNSRHRRRVLETIIREHGYVKKGKRGVTYANSTLVE